MSGASTSVATRGRHSITALQVFRFHPDAGQWGALFAEELVHRYAAQWHACDHEEALRMVARSRKLELLFADEFDAHGIDCRNRHALLVPGAIVVQRGRAFVVQLLAAHHEIAHHDLDLARAFLGDRAIAVPDDELFCDHFAAEAVNRLRESTRRWL